MRSDWTICRGCPPVGRRRVGRDWRANKSSGWYIRDIVVVVLASSVRKVVGRYVVVRMNLHKSFGRVPPVQFPSLALIPWQSSEKDDDDDKRKDSDSG